MLVKIVLCLSLFVFVVSSAMFSSNYLAVQTTSCLSETSWAIRL